jgi:hypothetical protein
VPGLLLSLWFNYSRGVKGFGVGGDVLGEIDESRYRERKVSRLAVINQFSRHALVIWHSLRELVSCPEVWLAQCLCEPNESLPYRKLVESAKAEEQRIRIRTSQGASIDGENLNTLGSRQFFRLS